MSKQHRWFQLVQPIWSWSLELICQCLKGLAAISPTLQQHMGKRFYSSQELQSIQQRRDQNPNSILFFCSSAGEYEQALPIAQWFERYYNQNVSVFFMFLSTSGIQFAKAKQEIRDYCLAPFDQKSQLTKLLQAIRPNFTIIIRHEIWPNFLSLAKRYGPVFLANATHQGGVRRHSFWSTLVYTPLFCQFDRIFCVDPQEIDRLSQTYGVSRSRFMGTGDSKVDQAFARISQMSRLTTIEKEYLSRFAQSDCIVLGSVWEADVKLILSAYALGGIQNKRFLVACHDLSPRNLKQIAQLFAEKYHVGYFSQLPLEKPPPKDLQVVMIDRLGLLAELYQFGSWAFVGGGVHHQVHNVLEPACHGVSVAFGTKYQNSIEARMLVHEQLANLCQTPLDIERWVKTKKAALECGSKTRAYLKPMIGAASRIGTEVMRCYEQTN